MSGTRRSTDLLGLLACQLGAAGATVLAQAVWMDGMGLGLPMLALFAGAWIWLRGRVARGGMTRVRLRWLARGTALVHLGVGATLYLLSQALGPVAWALPPSHRALGALALGMLAGLSAGGLCLCAGDAAGATAEGPADDQPGLAENQRGGPEGAP